MVKKSKVDFDDDLDLSFLDDLDSLSAGFDGKPPKDDRKPVMKIAGSIKDGAISKLKDRSFHRRMLKDSLPRGYGMALDALDTGADSLRDLYNTTAREIRPAMRDISRATKRMFPNKPAYMPDALWKKLDKLSADDGGSPSLSRAAQDEAHITMALGQIFTEQAKQQAIKEERQAIDEVADKMIRKKRFETTAELMASVQQGVSRLVGYQDTVTVAYQKKSLELQMRQYFTNKQLLDQFTVFSDKSMTLYEAIAKNTGLPEFVKLRGSEVAAQMAREQFIGKITERPREFISGILGRTAKNLGDKARGTINNNLTILRDMLSMTEGMGGGMDMKTLIAETAGGEMTAALGKKVSKRIRDAAGKSDRVTIGGSMLEYLVGNAEGLANNYARSETKRGGLIGAIEEAVKEAMGRGYRRDNSLQGSMMDSLDKAAMFNVHTQKTITDIIPGWLGKIHAELKMVRTGRSDIGPEVFDFESGRFVSQSQLSAKVFKRMFDPAAIEGTREDLDELMKLVDADKLSNKAKAALKKTFMRKASDGIAFDPKHYIDPMTYSDDIDFETRGELAGHFRALMGYGQDGKRSYTRENTGSQVRIADQLRRLQDNMPNARDELLRYAGTGQLNQLQGLKVLREDESGYSFNQDAYLNMMLFGPGQGPSGAGPAGGMTVGGFPKPPSPGMGPMGPFYPVGPRPSGPAAPAAAPETDKMEELFNKIADRVETAILEGSSKEENQMAVLWLEEIAGLLQNGGGGTGGGGSMGLRGLGTRAMNFGKGLFGKARGLAKRGQERVTGLFKKFLPFGQSVGGGLLNTAKELLGMGKDKAVDLYVKGKGKFPIITADGIRRGIYIDVNTQKVIKSIKDITGPISNLDGDIILNAEDFAKGLYDKAGNVLTRLIKRGMSFIDDVKQNMKSRLGKVFNLAMGAGRFAVDVLTGARDVYVQGESSPRLTAWGMRNGLYFDAKTLDTIRRVSDIKGDVLDNDGNVILTMAEAAAGLFDSEGRPIKSLTEKAKALFDKAISLPGKIIGKAKDAAGWVKDRITGMFSGMFGGGEGFSLFGGRDKELLDVVKRIHTLLDERIPEPKKFSRFDTDQDGDREGSYWDIMQRRKAKQAGAKGEGPAGPQQPGDKKDKNGGLFSLLGSLLGGAGNTIGGALSGAAGMLGLGKLKDMIFGGKGGAVTKAAGKTGMLSRLGGLASRALPALLPATTGLLSGIGTALGTAATAIAGVVSAPVLLGVAAVAGIAVGGYFLYKNLTTDKTSLNRLRMIQYGIDIDDEEQVKVIADLEALLEPYTMVAGTEGAQIKRVSPKVAGDILKLFNVDTEDKDAVESWGKWFQGRFKPVYLRYMTAINGLGKKVKIGELDKKLSVSEKKTLAAKVKFSATSSSPTAIMDSPWGNGDDIEYDEDDVEDEYEDALEAINELKDTSDTGKDKGASPAMKNKDKQASSEKEKEKDKQKAQKEPEPLWKRAMKTVAMASPPALAYKGAEWVYNKFRDNFYDEEKGKWVWPTMGRISSMWGMRKHPITGKQSEHKGVDVAAPEGTPVLAAAAGEIIRREYSDSYGNVIYIRHADGKVTRYAHMSKFEPGYAVGSPVSAGAVIGYVGNTGKSAGNHLHFEIRENDRWDAKTIDPLRMIKTRETQQAASLAKNEVNAARTGKDNDAAAEKVEDTMEGVDTLTSTATGETANKRRAAVDAQRVKYNLPVGADAEMDKAAMRAEEQAKMGVKEAATQKSYQSQMTQQNMQGMQSILSQQLSVQRNMEKYLKSIATDISSLRKGDGGSQPGGSQPEPTIRQARPSPGRATPPVKVSNSNTF